MPGQNATRVHGRIVAVQEQAFRLMTDSGQGLLLRLSASASNSPLDLIRFRDSGAWVEVEFTGEPGTSEGEARAIRRIEIA